MQPCADEVRHLIVSAQLVVETILGSSMVLDDRNLNAMSVLPPPASDEFFFACYSHEDYCQVRRQIDAMMLGGCAVRFDGGVYLGDGWFEKIRWKIEQSSGLVFFESERSMRSSACRREIQYASSLSKPIFPVKVNARANLFIADQCWNRCQVPAGDAKALAAS